MSTEFSEKPARRPRRSMIPVPRKHNTALQLYRPVGLGHTKHAAVRGDFHFTPVEWFNVNERIKKTVDLVLPSNCLIRGPGPGTCELHTCLGVALVAEVIIRPIKKPCSLGKPSLQREIRALANDPKHPAFRHTYDGGKVWFFFRILDQVLAGQPLLYDDGGDTGDTRCPIYYEEISQ